MNVRLNNTRTVHVAATYRNAAGETCIIGRACNQWPGGGHTRIRAYVTTDAVTCKSCLRITATPDDIWQDVSDKLEAAAAREANRPDVGRNLTYSD